MKAYTRKAGYSVRKAGNILFSEVLYFDACDV